MKFPKCDCDKYFDIKLDDQEYHWGKRVCSDCGGWLKWLTNPVSNSKLKRFLKPNYNGDYEIVFGRKHFGDLLSDVIMEDRRYLTWMSKSDFPKEVLLIINGVLEDGMQFISDLKRRGL